MEKKKKTRGGGACDVVTDLSEDVQVCLPSSVLAVGEEANEVNSSGQSVAAHRTICALLFLVFVSFSGPRGARRRPGSVAGLAPGWHQNCRSDS